MRIDFITTELRTGGAERCLTEVAIGLQQRDHRVRVISLAPLPEAGPRSALVERLKASRVPLESVNLKSIWQVPSAVRALTKFMSDDRPEIAQTFLYHANVLGTRAAVRAKVPVRVGAVRVAEHRRIRLAIERRATRQMAAIFCVSESVEAFVRNQLRPRQSCFVKTITNGVDVDRFRNAVPVDWSRYGLAPGGEVVLVVGRLHPQKGTDWLIRWAPELIKRSERTRLMVIGEGPEQAAVERCFKSLPAGRAALLPWQADIAPFYAASRVLCLPSRYEGMPNAVLEAMAAGRPVVATKVEGVTELLGDGELAQTVSFDDTSLLLERLNGFVCDSGHAAQVGSANQVRAAEKFSLAAMVSRYEDLYWRIWGLYRNIGSVKK